MEASVCLRHCQGKKWKRRTKIAGINFRNSIYTVLTKRSVVFSGVTKVFEASAYRGAKTSSPRCASTNSTLLIRAPLRKVSPRRARQKVKEERAGSGRVSRLRKSDYIRTTPIDPGSRGYTSPLSRAGLVMPLRDHERRTRIYTEPEGDVPVPITPVSQNSLRAVHNRVDLRIARKLFKRPGDAIGQRVQPAQVAIVVDLHRLLIFRVIGRPRGLVAQQRLPSIRRQFGAQPVRLGDPLDHARRRVRDDKAFQSYGCVSAYSMPSMPPHDCPRIWTWSRPSAVRTTPSSSTKRGTVHREGSFG